MTHRHRPARRQSGGRSVAACSILILCVSIAALGAAPGHTGEEGGPDDEWQLGPAIDPDSVGSGTLFWKSRKGMIPLPVLETEVRIEVTGILVRGSVTQRFHNPAGETIEAVYVFPMPERAAVSQMEMRIGPRRIRAVVQEKLEAERTYRAAKREGKKAALVEQERPNLFTTSAANVNPGETIEVVLEYLEEATYASGEFGLRFPLTFTPRYRTRSEPGKAQARTGRISPPFVGAASVPRVKLSARIDPGVPIHEVASRSHELDTFLDGPAWVVEPAGGTVIADRDFLLHWSPLVEDRPEAAMFVEDRQDGRYALMMLVPPADGQGGGWGLPEETMFVIDVSGSMDGPSIAQAREALLLALDRLRPEDSFNILRFNNSTHSFSRQFEPATESAVERAAGWVRALRANGGTEIRPALLEALSMLRGESPGRVKRLIFLTDGAVGNEDQLFRDIVENLGEVRLHAIGIGHAPNTHLMRKMAAFGRGSCDFISTGADVENGIDRFFARIERPVMSGLALDWEGAAPNDVYPARLSDLYPGEPLIVSFKLDGGAPPGGVVVHGRIRDRQIRTGFRIEPNAPSGSGVAARWARKKVASLIDGLHEGADPAMVRDAVVDVGLAFSLVTRYTSLVAVEEFASATGEAAPVRLANGLPAGSRLGGVTLPQGGTRQPLVTWIGAFLATLGLLAILALRARIV